MAGMLVLLLMLTSETTNQTVLLIIYNASMLVGFCRGYLARGDKDAFDTRRNS